MTTFGDEMRELAAELLDPDELGVELTWTPPQTTYDNAAGSVSGSPTPRVVMGSPPLEEKTKWFGTNLGAQWRTVIYTHHKDTAGAAFVPLKGMTTVIDGATWKVLEVESVKPDLAPAAWRLEVAR